MDKDIIKKYLTERFVNEEGTPGISVTAAANKKSGKINKDGVKAIEKEVGQYDKDLKKNKSEVKDKKFNYNSTEEMEYHNDMEIMNGQEMIEYDREPNKTFLDKAKEGIEGSSRMGNKGGKGMGNAEESWGASSDSFGKDFVKRVKATTKKREEAADSVMSFGDDVETVAKGSIPKGKHSAIQENNNKSQNKQPMKRLKFKKEFNGVGNALKMIPESYRVDNKEFEMTDGNESYTIRWEGTLTEGKATILKAANNSMINEDMQRMKALMGYKSADTLGSSKKVNRITENAIFSDILGKTRRLLGESEEIEGQTAPEGEWDDINVPQAADAKKDIEGSTSDDKGTQAPAPKVGEWEDISVPQAADAKKDIEGSVATEAKTNAPAPKEGYWEEINVPQAADAKKDIKEGEEEKEEIPVNNEDPKSQPGYVHEDEEEEEEEIVDENVKLQVSESTGKLYIVGATDKPFAVPMKDNAKALRNPKKYISEVFKR
jgi:hypothetical protein